MKKTWKYKKWIYAMYKGDTLLTIGTIDEICEKMHIKRDTFHYYRTNAYKNRVKNRKNKNCGYREIIKLEDGGYYE